MGIHFHSRQLGRNLHTKEADLVSDIPQQDIEGFCQAKGTMITFDILLKYYGLYPLRKPISSIDITSEVVRVGRVVKGLVVALFSN